MNYIDNYFSKIYGNQCPENSINTFIYARSNFAAEEGDCEKQVHAAKGFIQSHPNLHLKGIYMDIGSGSDFSRPALQKMLADIPHNDIQVILIQDVARLSRNIFHTFELARLFDNHKIACFCLISVELINLKDFIMPIIDF